MPNNFTLRILCAHCDQFPIECVESLCCCSILCSDCSSSLGECPNCNGPLECKPNIPLQRIINDMEVRCRVEDCNKLVTLGTRADHETICPYRFVDCPWSDDCGKIRRRELEEHLADCPHRDVPCPYMCGNMIEFSSIGYHLEVCDELVVECPNQCGETCARKDQFTHLESCENGVIACEYSQYGCPYNVTRGEHEQHCQDFMYKHLRLVCLRMRDQQDEIDLLRKDLDFQKSFYKKSWKLHEIIQLVAFIVLIFSAFPSTVFALPTFVSIILITFATRQSMHAHSLLEFITWQSISWIAQALTFGHQFFITVASTGMFVIAGRIALSECN